jgi:hypothetical protein
MTTRMFDKKAQKIIQTKERVNERKTETVIPT